jgi:hypothetical protein
MTNATIANVSSTPARSQNSMTNATVASVGATVSAKLLHLTYKGGSQDILVPDNVSVLTLEPGSLASLTPGAHVIVYVSESPDGKLSSSRISVGKNGSMPPV